MYVSVSIFMSESVQQWVVFRPRSTWVSTVTREEEEEEEEEELWSYPSIYRGFFSDPKAEEEEEEEQEEEEEEEEEEELWSYPSIYPGVFVYSNPKKKKN